MSGWQARRRPRPIQNPDGTGDGMFDGFRLDRVSVNGVTLRVRHGGSGPPSCCSTATRGRTPRGTRSPRCWPRPVTPWSARTCAATAGPAKPARPTDHAPYSKRAMAGDIVALMRAPGARALRRGRARPRQLRRAADWRWTTRTPSPASPCSTACRSSKPSTARDARFATAWWHWFFFAQPDKPERAILADPDAWYGAHARKAAMGAGEPRRLPAGDPDPDTVRAMLEDYRAGLRRRPGGRRGRPCRRAAGRVPDAGAVVGARRPGGPATAIR